MTKILILFSLKGQVIWRLINTIFAAFLGFLFISLSLCPSFSPWNLGPSSRFCLIFQPPHTFFNRSSFNWQAHQRMRLPRLPLFPSPFLSLHLCYSFFYPSSTWLRVGLFNKKRQFAYSFFICFFSLFSTITTTTTTTPSCSLSKWTMLPI